MQEEWAHYVTAIARWGRGLYATDPLQVCAHSNVYSTNSSATMRYLHKTPQFHQAQKDCKYMQQADIEQYPRESKHYQYRQQQERCEDIAHLRRHE